MFSSVTLILISSLSPSAHHPVPGPAQQIHLQPEPAGVYNFFASVIRLSLTESIHNMDIAYMKWITCYRWG
jgi:hypothetical protein